MRYAFMTGAALAVAGCGAQPTESPSANTGETTADGARANVGVQSQAPAAATAAEGELLTGIPPYPNIESGGARMAGSSPQGTGGIQTFRTADSAGRVADFYAGAAERAGFTIANRTDMGHTAGVTARRGQGELLNATATRVGAMTEVQIIASRGPN